MQMKYSKDYKLLNKPIFVDLIYIILIQCQKFLYINYLLSMFSRHVDV